MPKIGYKRSIEQNRKISGSNNYQWKGDDVGYIALHIYIHKYLPKPEFCQICNKLPPLDVACITGIYNRDFKNWQWLCRSCHMKYDGTIKNLIMYTKGCIPWNKGLKGAQVAWNKGKKHPVAAHNPQTFKKGHVPWNKGISTRNKHNPKNG